MRFNFLRPEENIKNAKRGCFIFTDDPSRHPCPLACAMIKPSAHQQAKQLHAIQPCISWLRLPALWLPLPQVPHRGQGLAAVPNLSFATSRKMELNGQAFHALLLLCQAAGIFLSLLWVTAMKRGPSLFPIPVCPIRIRREQPAAQDGRGDGRGVVQILRHIALRPTSTDTDG